MHEGQRDPEIAAKLAQERQRGGYLAPVKRAGVELPTTVDLGSAEGVKALLEATSKGVLENRLAPSQGHAVAALANVAMRLAELALDQRIARLERLAEQRVAR